MITPGNRVSGSHGLNGDPMSHEHTSIQVLLIGAEGELLDRVSRLLAAIREVTYQVVVHDEPAEIHMSLMSCIDIIIHLLLPLPEKDQPVLQQLQALPLPLVLIASDPKPRGEAQESYQTSENCFVIKPPFDERCLLSVLDQIHDDILLRRQPVDDAGETHPGSQLVVVTGAGGGVGVSLLSACLARLVSTQAGSDLNTLLLDGDWRYGSQSTLNDCQPINDLRELLERRTIDQTVLNSFLTRVNDRLSLLCSSPERMVNVRPRGSLPPLLSVIRERPGMTIADVPFWNQDLLGELSAKASHLIIVLRPDIDGLRRARLLLTEADKTLPPESITMVVNGVSRHATLDQHVMQSVLNRIPVLIPDDQRAIIHALESSRLPVDNGSGSSFGRTLKPLLNQLLPVETTNKRRWLAWQPFLRSVY